MTARKCIEHNQLRICEGDIVAVLLPSYKMQTGVVRGFHKTVIALAGSCKNAKANKYVNLQHALEIYVIGSCN